MPPDDNYYALLGVPPGADRAAIQSACRALMRRYHPDLNASSEAATNAKIINEAYACLRDPVQRAAYDRLIAPRSRARGSPYPSSPPTCPRPVWTGPTPRAERSTPWYHPSSGKAIGLAVGAVVTGITFTITSTIPPVVPLVAKTAPAVSIHPAPTTPTVDGSGFDCRGRRMSASRPIRAVCGS